MSPNRRGFIANQWGASVSKIPATDFSHIKFFETVVSIIQRCNSVAKNPSQRISSVYTTNNGKLVFIQSADGREKELLCEGLTPDFCKFLCRMIIRHSFASRKIR